MRPLLSVVLVPSTPMKDERLSTAGSFRMIFASCLLAVGHRGEGDGLGGFGDALDHAGVLNREEALGDDVEQIDGDDQRADARRAG